MRQRAKGRLICIIGADGTGKTTVARDVMDALERRGVHCHYTWFRFQHLLSLPLLAYCRLAGLIHYVYADGTRYGGWEFYRSRIMKRIAPWLVGLDAWVLGLVRVRLPLWRGETVVCDRFVYDTLVDLMVATRDGRVHHRLVGRLLLKIVPRDAPVVCLDLPEGIILARRPSMAHDPHLSLRRRYYLELAGELGLPVIQAAGSREENMQQVLGLLEGNLQRAWPRDSAAEQIRGPR